MLYNILSLLLELNMTIPIRKFRELVFQWLFQEHFGESDPIALMDYFKKALKVSKKNLRAVEERVGEINKHKIKIDQEIATFSSFCSIERICFIELNILRLAIFELLV